MNSAAKSAAKSTINNYECKRITLFSAISRRFSKTGALAGYSENFVLGCVTDPKAGIAVADPGGRHTREAKENAVCGCWVPYGGVLQGNISRILKELRMHDACRGGRLEGANSVGVFAGQPIVQHTETLKSANCSSGRPGSVRRGGSRLRAL